MRNIAKLAAAAQHSLAAGDFEQTEEGVLIRKSIIARGRYRHWVNGKDEQVDPNLVPLQGLNYAVDVTARNQTPASAWYIAPFAGAITPASGWTAANFAATASEITSGTEGYSQATRPQWVGAAAVNGKSTNLASKASFSIVCTTTLTINGAAMLSSNVKGGTAGVLLSASRFSVARTLTDGDEWDCVYEFELTDS